jgi:hypothetical protein
MSDTGGGKNRSENLNASQRKFQHRLTLSRGYGQAGMKGEILHASCFVLATEGFVAAEMLLDGGFGMPILLPTFFLPSKIICLIGM